MRHREALLTGQLCYAERAKLSSGESQQWRQQAISTLAAWHFAVRIARAGNSAGCSHAF